MSAWDYIPDYDFEWYRESSGWAPLERRPRERTCRICRKGHLHWGATVDGWRLMDGREFHTCSPVRSADEELVTVEED